MSWKPCRGHGITLQDAFDREMKYRMLLSEYEYHPVGFMEHSKAYYHWLVAERDLRNCHKSDRDRVEIEDLYGEMVSGTLIKSFASHKDMCYKKLQPYIK